MKIMARKSMVKKQMSVKEWLNLKEKSYDSSGELSYEERVALREELDELYKYVVPEVGDTGSQILWSDVYPFEVVKIHTPDRVSVRMRNYTIADPYEGSGEMKEGFTSEHEISRVRCK